MEGSEENEKGRGKEESSAYQCKTRNFHLPDDQRYQALVKNGLACRRLPLTNMVTACGVDFRRPQPPTLPPLRDGAASFNDGGGLSACVAAAGAAGRRGGGAAGSHCPQLLSCGGRVVMV